MTLTSILVLAAAGMRAKIVTGAVKERRGHYPVRDLNPPKAIPVIDPREQRIRELESAVSRLTEENVALREAANAFAKHHAKEKARADSLNAQLAEQAVTLRAAEEAIRQLTIAELRVAERLTMYEGASADFTRRGVSRPYPQANWRHPEPVAREHLCCIPARHDFLTRAARSLGERVERSLFDSFLPRVASHAELNDHAIVNMDGRAPHATPVIESGLSLAEEAVILRMHGIPEK